MSFFRGRQQRLLGVDMGESHVHAIMLERQCSGLRISRYGRAALPARQSVHAAHSADTMAAALRRALDQLPGKPGRNRPVAAAVATSAVIAKVIDMPADLAAEDLENQVDVEAAQHIPYPIDEVSIDFDILAPSAATSALSHQRVLLVAARTETVAQRVDMLAQAGLSAQVMDVEAFAVARALPLLASQMHVSEHALIAVLDVGEYGCRLMVFDRDCMVYSREHDFGGHELKTMLSSREHDAHDADQPADRLSALEENLHAEHAVVSFREALLQQLMRLLQFFHAGDNDRDIAQLVIIGAYARISALDERVPASMNMPCCIADPLQSLALTGHPQTDRDLKRHAPQLMTALGLAMRRAP